DASNADAVVPYRRDRSRDRSPMSIYVVGLVIVVVNVPAGNEVRLQVRGVALHAADVHVEAAHLAEGFGAMGLQNVGEIVVRTPCIWRHQDAALRPLAERRVRDR